MKRLHLAAQQVQCNGTCLASVCHTFASVKQAQPGCCDRTQEVVDTVHDTILAAAAEIHPNTLVSWTCWKCPLRKSWVVWSPALQGLRTHTQQPCCDVKDG